MKRQITKKDIRMANSRHESFKTIFFKRNYVTPSCPPGGSNGLKKKKLICNAGDIDSIPGLGRSPGEGNGYPLQDKWRAGGEWGNRG